MKFKLALLICVLFGITAQVIANPTSEELKRSFAKVRAPIEENASHVAQAAAGGITLAHGIAFGVLVIHCLHKNKESASPLSYAWGLSAASSMAYSGYYTLNNAIYYRLTETIKNSLQKAKVWLLNLKINEHA